MGRGRVGSIAVGAAAGAVGTAAMDLLLFGRYRRQHGTEPLRRWEFAATTVDWNTASAPGKLGEKAIRLVTRRPVPDRWARATTNAVHWVTGLGWGAQYALLAVRPTRHPLARGLALGPAVWLIGYAVLPAAGIYQPIWTYDARTLRDDFTAHLLFGATTSVTVAALTGARGCARH